MLSLTTAFIPQICFHVQVLCWSVVVCVAVVYVHMSTCIECTCLLCAACVGREKGTTNLKDVTCSAPSKIYTRDSPISLLFVVPFRGKDCGKAGLGGCPTNTPWKKQCRDMPRKIDNRHNKSHRCLTRGPQMLVRWELLSIDSCLIGNRKVQLGCMTNQKALIEALAINPKTKAAHLRDIWYERSFGNICTSI